jgi:hypothetical protein
MNTRVRETFRRAREAVTGKTAFIAIGASAVTIGSLLFFALPNDAADEPQPLIVLATMPPEPTPPPAILIPARELWVPNDAPSTVNGADAKPGPNGKLQISEGTLGVILAGDNSQASILSQQGIKYVRLGDVYEGHRVIDISMLGVRLDNGRLIPRGLGVNPGAAPGGAVETAPAQVVPAIGAQTGQAQGVPLSPIPPIAPIPTPTARPFAPQQPYQPTQASSPGQVPGGVFFGPPPPPTVMSPFAIPTPNGGPNP